MIFVNSMGDLFHECVPVEFIRKVFDTMRLTPRHTYQALTYRSKRLRLLSASLEWPNNLWMGVTVENRVCVQRIDWAIICEESCPSARPVSAEWIRELREECVLQNGRFFFKQWGGQRRRKGGRLLDGRTWDEYPSARTLVQILIRADSWFYRDSLMSWFGLRLFFGGSFFWTQAGQEGGVVVELIQELELHGDGK